MLTAPSKEPDLIPRLTTPDGDAINMCPPFRIGDWVKTKPLSDPIWISLQHTTGIEYMNRWSDWVFEIRDVQIDYQDKKGIH